MWPAATLRTNFHWVASLCKKEKSDEYCQSPPRVSERLADGENFHLSPAATNGS